MSSAGQIVDTLFKIIFLIFVCLLSSNTGTKWERPSCPAHNPLIYAGRHTLHPGLVNNVTTSCGQRVFILRLPPRHRNNKSKFLFGPGKGKIFIRRGRCKAPEPPQESTCPTPPDRNEGVCSRGTEDLSRDTCSVTLNTTLIFNNVTSTTIEVTWTKLDDYVSLGPVAGYAVDYREEGRHNFSRVKKNENTSHIFTDLMPDTVYEFRLVLTACGLPVDDILTSEINSTRTSCGDIGPVTNLTVIDTGNYGELYISWEKPIKESNTCEVSRYQIDYTLVRYLALSEDEANNREQSVQVNGSEYDIILKELEDYASYLVSVTPITTWSDENHEAYQTGNTIENIPSQVENFSVNYANLSVIQLTWSLPARPRGLILYYTISFEPISGTNETTGATDVPVDATLFDLTNTPVYTLTDLHGEANYSIRIQALNDVGPGNWSELIVETTDTTFEVVDKVTTTDVTALSNVPATGVTPADGPITTIIAICAAAATVTVTLPLIAVCLICLKRKQKGKEKEKVPTVSGLVNGPSQYQSLHERGEDIARYMKIGDFGPSTYMMYGQGSEDNQLYTGIDISQGNSSSLDVAVPSYDASGYTGLMPKSTNKDYTQLLNKKEDSLKGDAADDENGNKNTFKDPSGYMGLQNRPQASDYTKLTNSGNGVSPAGNPNDILEKTATLKDPSGYMGLQNRPHASDYTKLTNPENGDLSTGNPNDNLEKNGGSSTFHTPSFKLNDKLTESPQQDDGNDNSVGNGIIQGSGDRSKNGTKQTVRREQYERNVIPDELLLQVPYFEHIGSEDDRISYFEPIADDEDGNENPYNASAYGKPRTSYETSLQVPVKPFLKRKVSEDRASESYETAAGSYERPLDESGQPLNDSDTHRENNSQVATASSQNDDVSNRTSREYFEPIGSDDDNNTTEKKEGSYATSTREFYETIPDGLRKSQKKVSEGSKYGRSNYSKSINTAQSKKSKIPARLPYEKSLLSSELPLKSIPERKNHTSGYEDAASGYGRHSTSDSRFADNSKYFKSKTGTMKSNASLEYFEPIADNEDYMDDPEVIRNRLENYEMIPEMRKHLRTTEKNSSKLCLTTDGVPPSNDNKMTRIPKRGEKSKKMVYESSLANTDGDEKLDPSNKPAGGRTNSAANRERWREALRKTSAGHYQKSVDTADNIDKTSSYTSGNYIEPIASDEEEDSAYETTQHERIEVNGGTKQNANQKRLQIQPNLTVDSNVSNEEEPYASATNGETLDETDPEALYQAIPAYGSFQDSRATESGVLGDIKIKNLPRQLWNGSSSPEITLTEEFQTLPRGQQHPWTTAKAKDDDADSGILPYDHSRVKLSDISGDWKSDYYNGSYIEDQFNKMNFIAAKVPKKATTENFWRMVWESKTEIVVILASGKSYLPLEKEAKKSVGRFTLTWSTSVEDSPEFYIRHLEIKKGNVVQMIKICQHRVWHETCRLPSPTSVITFVRQVKSVRRKESVPIIVQCSNGVGATGVFIAVYSLLNYLKSGRGSSVHDFVRTIRQHRVDMVQSRSEYLLVYETLISAILAPENAVTVDLLMRMNLIERQDALEREFETLTKLNKFSIPRSTNAGAHETNISKNRYPEVLPLDSYRVVLKSLEKSGSGSYINATLINSANSNTTFIMAQSPLPSTTEDFWRMIYQYECSSVVSMSDMDSTNEIIGEYLPKSGQKRYGKILVKCISNPENAGGLLQQRFSLSHSSSKKKFEVSHFQLLSWPREESQVAGFIRIMMKMQPMMKSKRTVTVHCLDGASRCGVFVAIATELGNLKSRGDIDVFQTVHELKGRCRHVITKYDDYFLCYRVLKGIVDAREHDYETLPSEM